MFAYVRYIALACVGLGSVVTVLLVSMFANTAKDELLSASMRTHTIISQSVASGLWRQYAPRQPRMIASPAGVIAVPVDTASFPKEAEKFIRQFEVERIGLYVFKEGTVYKLAGSAGPEWRVSSGEVGLWETDKVAQGRPVQHTLKAEVGGKKVRLLQTLIPVPPPGENGERVLDCMRQVSPTCRPEVFVEVVSDITAGWAMVDRNRWIFIGASVGLFMLVGGIVMVAVSRAETIIAKQHEVNLELTAAAAAAEAQSRDKSMFLANISHELRTPLNAIIGFSDIVRQEAKSMLEKQYQDYIDDIHSSGKHLLALINDILDYSKAEAGKLQIEYSEADMLKVIRNSMRMVMPRAEESQVTLIENLPKDPLVVVTDIKKLKQVILNLLSNAVKFTPAGGDVRVSMWEDIVTRDLVVEVKDSGIGIAPKDISRVMMPFVQVDSTLARRFEGTGLGLPLSKKYIESMGGQFFIESEVNKGTSITLRLPIKPAYVGSSGAKEEEA